MGRGIRHLALPARDDLVVLIPEYELLSDEAATGRIEHPFRATTGSYWLLGSSAEEVVHDALRQSIPGLRSLLRGIVLHGFGYRGKQPYSFEVDARGNAVHPPRSASTPRDGDVCRGVSARSARELSRFAAAVRERGARIVVALPWLQVTDSAVGREPCHAVAKHLARDFELLFDPTTLNRRDEAELFSDTVYHLSLEGRKLRTRQLGRQLRGLLRQPSAEPVTLAGSAGEVPP